MKNRTRKTHEIRFKLFYEYLPSDEKVFAAIRRVKAEQRKKLKRDAERIATWAITVPGIRKRVVARMRRVKR